MERKHIKRKHTRGRSSRVPLSAPKRRLLIVIAAAVLALLLLLALRACRGASPEPEPTPAPTVDPHEGQVEVTNGAGGTMWVDKAERLPAFSLDRYAFSVTDNVVSYTKDGLNLVQGIDVSEYQGEINWKEVAASGVEFAIVRVGWRGYTGGALSADTRYKENITGARAAGLKVGAYFFSQAVSVMEAAEEAVLTAQLLEGLTLDLPVFFDWETIGSSAARTDSVSARTVTDCCLEFCHLLESEGYQTGVYSYIPNVYDSYILDDIADITIWMADPGNWPEFYYEHTYWQYSFTGTVPGITGNVDMDVMYEPVSAPEPASADEAGTEAAG